MTTNLGGFNKGSDGMVVGLVQLQRRVIGTPEDLARQTERICGMVGEVMSYTSTTDLVVFPEYTLQGLSTSTSPELLVTLDGPEVAAFTMAAVRTEELHPDEEPARWHTVFWAIVLGTVAVSMMYAGGMSALQTLTVMTAFPLIFIVVILTLSFRKWLKEDRADERAVAPPPARGRLATDAPEPAREQDPRTPERPAPRV